MVRLNRMQVEGITRHILTAAGFYFAANGYGNEDLWVSVTGGLVTVAGLLWSLRAPEKTDG